VNTWFVLAPGPSMSAALAERVRGRSVCVINNVFELAPWADILVATDHGWWRRHPLALKFMGRKCGAHEINGIEIVRPNTFGTESSSGVLALDEVRNQGATRIVMLGFDMHGTHFFGPYTNGCRNTPQSRREEHQAQFAQWARQNRIDVVNCTEGTMLRAFRLGKLEDYLG